MKYLSGAGLTYLWKKITALINTREPAFTKNTAFNKAFGSAAGTVCQGNDARLSDARKNPAALTFTGGVTGTYDGSTAKSVTIPTTLPASDVPAWAKAAAKPNYTKAEVGLGNVDNTSDVNKPISTAVQTALNGKEPSFTKNTGFNKNFGTGAGTVCQGNDSRLSNARTPTAHTHPYTDLTGDVPFINPNLLINGDFQLWRRGSTFSNIANKYFADRWIAIGSKAINVTKVSTGARIQAVDSSYARFGQYIEGKLTQGKYTLSISINGKKDKITFDVVGDNSESFVNCDSCYASLSYASNGSTLLLIGVSSADFEVNLVKLELGEIATPSVPRSYGEEFALCQRYYQAYGMDDIRIVCYSNASSNKYFDFTFAKTMRVTPTLLGNWAIFNHDSTGITMDKEFTIDRISSYNMLIYSTFQSKTELSYIRPSSFIRLDAEIY